MISFDEGYVVYFKDYMGDPTLRTKTVFESRKEAIEWANRKELEESEYKIATLESYINQKLSWVAYNS